MMVHALYCLPQCFSTVENDELYVLGAVLLLRFLSLFSCAIPVIPFDTTLQQLSEGPGFSSNLSKTYRNSMPTQQQHRIGECSVSVPDC